MVRIKTKLRGFTLVEVMVATGAASIMMLGIFSGIGLMTRTMKRTSLYTDWQNLLQLMRVTYSSPTMCKNMFYGQTYANTTTTLTQLGMKSTPGGALTNTFLSVGTAINGIQATQIQMIPVPSSSPYPDTSTNTTVNQVYLSIAAKRVTVTNTTASPSPSPSPSSSSTPDLYSGLSYTDSNTIQLTVWTNASNVIQSCSALTYPNTSFYCLSVQTFLVVPCTGNVGIGTSSPLNVLDIFGPNGSASNNESSVTNSVSIETGRSNGDQMLYIGNDKTNKISYVQSAQYGASPRPLLLNARGGNIGIGMGTSIPAISLDIVGPDGNSSDDETNTNHTFSIETSRSSNGQILYMGNDRTVSSSYIQSASYGVGTRSLHLNPRGGNIGIGMGRSLPWTKLDIVGPSSDTSSAETSPVHTFSIETGRSNGEQILYMGNSKTNYYSFIQSAKYGVSSGPLLLNARGGNIGIGMGTSTPTVTLDIFGPSGNYSNNEYDTTNTFSIETGRSNSDQILYMGNNKANNYSYIQSVKYGVSTQPLLLNARGGNVGIGTSTPNYTLEVNGTIKSGGYKQSSCYWTGWLCGQVTCNDGYFVAGFNMGWQDQCTYTWPNTSPNFQLYCCH